MSLAVGWHYLSDDDPLAPLAAATFLDVAGAKPGSRSPETMCRPYVKGRPDVLRGIIVDSAIFWANKNSRIQFLNEPNHPEEKYGGNPQDYLTDYRQFRDKVKASQPSARIYWAPPSPGVANWQQWFEGAEEADGICVHAYGSLTQMKDVVGYVMQRFSNKPLWIGECNFGPGPGRYIDLSAWASNDFKPFLDWCSRYPQLEAVTYFAYLWPNPDMPMATKVDGAGTTVEKVLRAWQSPTPKEKKMLDGLSLWVWYWQDSYINVANRIGAKRLLIKAADGLQPWAQWSDAATKTRAAGLEAVPWSYNYGNPAEIDTLLKAAPNEVCYIIDPETEYEKLSKDDQWSFIKKVTLVSANPKTSVGWACFSRPADHPQYSFYSGAVSLWLPMVAWTAWEPAEPGHWFDVWDAAVGSAEKTVPWLPAYTDDTELLDGAGLVASVKLALQRYGGVTLWAAHSITENMIAALEKEKTMDEATKAKVLDHLNTLWGYANEIDATAQDMIRLGGEQAQAAAYFKERIIALKQDLGLDS